ncbi:hypothetical protein FRUB_06211 [Fimbriiglobus ruber]|uniref:Cytochrome c domain-containing protein n=1 Tax=Fimbriiglobus ruber TaxID=1908690 RepID=A0A225DPJ4_9BACT|nr:hypothetical protein FRUB_06211 [Fimbriiglobus ruber]
MTVRDGLELWLDAARATGAEKPPADNRLARWSDASGKGRHLTQSRDDARPVRIPFGGVAIVRFDGIDDHLRAVKQATELDAFTVIVVGIPRTNPGPFRGMLAFNAAGQRDYLSGLNIDFGPTATPRFSVLNAEGRGFGGARNLRTGDSPFGQLTTIELASDAGGKKVALAVDGKREGERPRTDGRVSLDEITVGSRFYNNGPGDQRADGFARYDVAEVLVYNRTLSADERAVVYGYLDAKYAALKAAPPPDAAGRGDALVPVKNPPPVQVFVPGFAVRELPVDLTNINNVKYRPDGTLVVLGYDGNIWLLRDTDGDGVEDKATLFWENKNALSSPIGMDLTPPGYKLGTGVFVASKGKCVLVVDTDGDGKADKEITVAGGWTEFSVNIDVTGVAVDPKDGSVWFGRGTPNYSNGYLLDKNGVAKYSLADERGTIQRVSPDFKTREVVATGIRFPVGMRFNRHGDLFATDQEGATWLPNGNPLDELLHIQKGRHYGFPPRHPKYLSGVIDEPSTFDYGPQHQSTCGLNFNEPVTPGGPTFGPKDWAGDVFVTGYSRGKLFHTKLAKTAAGYVARTDLFACLNMLTVDACVSPDGGLIVACHSGGPDWGSGPRGKGKLYKLTYTDREQPQPVLAWASGPREVRVAFDRPLDPESLKDAVRQTKLTAGPFVRAGDRFESLWPGYAVVQAEKAAPRFDVPVHSVQLTADRRTLVLATDPLAAAVHYALTLPGPVRSSKDALPQHPQIDLAFDLSGCEATWTDKAGKVTWQGWLPSFDLTVARRFTSGSADHDALWKAMTAPGELTLAGKLNLTNMLRPAVQPGSRLDHEWPTERVTVSFTSTSPPTVEVKGATPKTDGKTTAFTIQPETDKLTPFRLRLPADGPPADLAAAWHTNEDERQRPWMINRVLLPWADTSAKTFEQTPARPAAELEGGSWARGRAVFFSEQAGCSKCHTVHGRGGSIGPDLSNLVHRDYASVLRDITLPSFAINPDYLTYIVALKDGRTLTGVVQTAGTKIRVADTKGVTTEVDRDDIDSMKPSAVSTMPDGLPATLGPERMKDLLTYLLTMPVSMPRDYAGAWPKPRLVAEVNAALAGAPTPPEKTRPIRVVLVARPKDHGPGEHDYPAWQKAWKELLGSAAGTEVITAWEWPAKEEFGKADVMVFFQHGDWNRQRAADVDAFLERGGGLVYVHWAIDGRKEGPEFAKRIGLAGMGSIGFRHGGLTLDVNRATNHPILRNFDKLPLIDETYWKMTGSLKEATVLATAVEEKEPQPQLWSLERGRGRVFVSIPGHYSWTFDDPLFRLLLLRGIAWTAKEPVDRFNDLVWPGAHVAK